MPGGIRRLGTDVQRTLMETYMPRSTGKKAKKTSSPDKLAKSGRKGKVELSEDDLKKVSGGTLGVQHYEKWLTS